MLSGPVSSLPPPPPGKHYVRVHAGYTRAERFQEADGGEADGYAPVHYPTGELPNFEDLPPWAQDWLRRQAGQAGEPAPVPPSGGDEIPPMPPPPPPPPGYTPVPVPVPVPFPVPSPAPVPMPRPPVEPMPQPPGYPTGPFAPPEEPSCPGGVCGVPGSHCGPGGCTKPYPGEPLPSPMPIGPIGPPVSPIGGYNGGFLRPGGSYPGLGGVTPNISPAPIPRPTVTPLPLVTPPRVELVFPTGGKN